MSNHITQPDKRQRRLNALAALHIEYLPAVTNTTVEMLKYNPSHHSLVVGASKSTFADAFETAKHVLPFLPGPHRLSPAVLVVFDDVIDMELGPLWRNCCLHGNDPEELTGIPVSRNDFVEGVSSLGIFEHSYFSLRGGNRYEVLILKNP